MDLRVQGRSPRTLRWYEQKMLAYLAESGVEDLPQLTAFELKRHIAGLQERGLSENTVHGSYQVIKALVNWAEREGYAVDHAVLRVRAPKVPVKEMGTYTEAQMQAIFAACPPGWPPMAVMILLGTGMRVSELCALELADFEDDGEGAFLKVQRGKGAKFRRVPVSQRLRRELVRYVNRTRPAAAGTNLLAMADGRSVTLRAATAVFQRIKKRVGFQVHAHKFRHTFATEYLRNGGELERLRRILGHSTYVMVMRYVHLDKGDLMRDFDQRSPF